MARGSQLKDAGDGGLLVCQGYKDPGPFGVAEGHRPSDETTTTRLEPAARPHSGGDSRPLKLSKRAHDLSHGSTHRVLGVIGKDLASVCGKHSTTAPPDHGQGCLLDREEASEPVELRYN